MNQLSLMASRHEDQNEEKDKLLAEIKAQQSETAQLVMLTQDLRKKIPGQWYVPLKHDPLDKAVAQYLNYATPVQPSHDARRSIAQMF